MRLVIVACSCMAEWQKLKGLKGLWAAGSVVRHRVAWRGVGVVTTRV